MTILIVYPEDIGAFTLEHDIDFTEQSLLLESRDTRTVVVKEFTQKFLRY